MKKVFRLNKREGKLWGVCAGIADYTGVDATIVRVGLVLVTLLGAFPWSVIAYAAAAFVAKPAPAYASFEGEEAPRLKTSAFEMKESEREIDRRMAEVESFVATSNTRLAQEIDSLR